MHRLLQRQIKSAMADGGEIDLDRLLELVSQAYEETDTDRRRTDRSITLMIEELDLANAELRESQNRRFEAAISNMSQGLVMFDADSRLVVCNKHFANLYELPECLTQPGTDYWDIFECRTKNGTLETTDSSAARETRRKWNSERTPFTTTLTMLNGRVVQMHFQPLDDGGWVSTHEDITERHRHEEMIRFLARHDSLTGLANRVTFREAMSVAERQIARGEKIAVFCVDLDNFKPINDTQGHHIGDALLKAVARRIRDNIGPDDIAARLGGDEFAVLIRSESDEPELAERAAGIIRAISMPISTDGLHLRITASIGIAVAPRDGKATETLMRHADLALYRAKAERRGNYCFFEREMDERRRRRQGIEAGLRRALDNGDFILHYQPLVSTSSRRIVACEALVRWERPGEGLVAPAEFIPIAEETGLIREIGAWVLDEACRTAASWPGDMRVAVNVSAIQFEYNDLIGQVKHALASSGLTPERLELEITESLFMADDEHNRELLHDLRHLGVRIALDDFGTGYSSLSYLRKFPFDKIKIDRSFVMSVAETSETEAIIRAIVQLASAMGMCTTAEGIETAEQLDLVTGLGCASVQGYLFSPPLPEKAIGTLIEKMNADTPAPMRQVS